VSGKGGRVGQSTRRVVLWTKGGEPGMKKGKNNNERKRKAAEGEGGGRKALQPVVAWKNKLSPENQ